MKTAVRVEDGGTGNWGTETEKRKREKTIYSADARGRGRPRGMPADCTLTPSQSMSKTRSTLRKLGGKYSLSPMSSKSSIPLYLRSRYLLIAVFTASRGVASSSRSPSSSHDTCR
jgi:hypothetical protein